MKKLTVSSLASLFLAGSALAAEAPSPPASEPAGLGELEAEMMPPAKPTPPQARRPAAKTEVAQAAEPAPASTEAPPPAVGWSRGKRAPVYLQLMLMGEAYVEDAKYRLTTRESRTLGGGGGLVRLGGSLGLHNRVGLRLQSFMRPTTKVITSTPTATSEWGMVAFGYAGPEFLRVTDSGLYFGGSLGLAGVMSRARMDCRNGYDYGTGPSSCGPERATGGLAIMGSLGYELRTSKWFALSAEATLGLYGGADDNDKAMNGAVLGLGVGVGF